ncbi:hypothetical protein [Wenjunlia tyrosinilytica]|jgi:hypothetical protein|uniref:Uncharacterized protein n=1 Tax=Wenjunlia tyrosinilytica TaxID=1544741 RepID=A0A917ZXT4_9ACTN|nr:hypothetical protein [Wenjunlia tyrosinilytica]GGO98039.1 hypothetical protein GCM10012280_61240 [Wenjunlia tyrosinilytica]
MSEGRKDIAAALAGLLDDAEDASGQGYGGSAADADLPPGAVLEGHVFTSAEQAEHGAVAPQRDHDEDLADDSEVATTADDPQGKYVSKRAAKREFDRLVRNTGKLSRDIALWVHRGGPALLGFKSAAEGVMAIKEVAKSQAYRDVYLAEVAEQLALASGLFNGSEDVRRILDLPGLTAKNAELLRPQLAQLTEEVQRQANREAASSDVVVEEILPRVVKEFVQRKKNGGQAQPQGEAGSGQPHETGPAANPYVGAVGPNAFGPSAGVSDDDADADRTGPVQEGGFGGDGEYGDHGYGDGDLPPEISIPEQGGEAADDTDPCPHCSGTGRIPRQASAFSPQV